MFHSKITWSFHQKSHECALTLTDLLITSLLFDLNHTFIKGNFAFGPGLIYILDLTSRCLWSAICLKIMTSYTCGFFPRILAIFPATQYTCVFLSRILAFFPALWGFYSQVLWPFSYKRAYTIACEAPDAFPVVASLPPKNRRYFSEGEKRRPEMRLLFAGYYTMACVLSVSTKMRLFVQEESQRRAAIRTGKSSK